jgi:hypothetical protein
MTKTTNKEEGTAWVQLYLAQKRQKRPKADLSSRGRPPQMLTRTRTNVMFSQSDLKLIHKWQERFRGILGRKPSIGEVAGILAHMAEGRLDALGLAEFPVNLEELANYMIGKNKPD